MKLPNSHGAWIPRAKLEEYLLDPDHPTGGAKARVFTLLGYTREDPGAFERSLLELAQRGVVHQEVTTGYGAKYVVDGYLEGVQGTSGKVMTVW